MSLNNLNKFKTEIDTMVSEYKFGNPVRQDQLELHYDDKVLRKLFELELVVQPILSLGDLIEEIQPIWLPTVGEDRKDAIRLSCNYLLKFFGAGTRVDKIKSLDVKKYIIERKCLGRAESTIKKEILIGKKLFDLGIFHELARFNPFVGHGLSGKAQNKPKEIDSSILWAVEQNIDDMFKPIFMLTRYTGCRPSEANVLRWEDVDFVDRMISMPNDKTAMKTDREFRDVPIFDELYDYLFELSMVRCGEYVISYDALSRLSRSRRKKFSVYRPWMKAVNACGVEAWLDPFRRLRSNRENELFRQGKLKSEEILYLMGHTRDVSNAHYRSEVSPEDMRQSLGWNCGEGRTSRCTSGDNRRGPDRNVKGTAKSKNPMRVPAALCKPIEEHGLAVSVKLVRELLGLWISDEKARKLLHEMTRGPVVAADPQKI
jgi:integrase